MKMDLKWVENEDLRLKLRLNESPRCSESNGSPPAPPKPAINSEASNSGIPGKSAYPIFCLRYAGPISQTGHGHMVWVRGHFGWEGDGLPDSGPKQQAVESQGSFHLRWLPPAATAPMVGSGLRWTTRARVAVLPASGLIGRPYSCRMVWSVRGWGATALSLLSYSPSLQACTAVRLTDGYGSPN